MCEIYHLAAGCPGEDFKELLGLCLGSVVVLVVFAYDGLGVAELIGGLVERFVLGYPVGDRGMAKYVVGKVESCADFDSEFLEAFRTAAGDGELLERVGSQPCLEVGRHLELPEFLHLRSAG